MASKVKSCDLQSFPSETLLANFVKKERSKLISLQEMGFEKAELTFSR
jgi:hypothetical protein